MNIDLKQLLSKPWKVLKCWQSPDFELILQVAFAGLPVRLLPVKKFYVVIDAKQASFGLRLESDKPDFKPFNNPLVNLWRKYCRSVLICDISQEAKSGNIYLSLHNTSEAEASRWHLMLSKSRPPEIALINPQQEIIVRHGMKGTFTKKRPFEEQLPEFAGPEAASELKLKLLESFLQKLTQAQISQQDLDLQDEADLSELENETQAERDINLSGEQRLLLARLKRRLKTARKAFVKQAEQIPDEEQIRLAEQKARFLQTYAYLLEPGDTELKLGPELTGLDEELCIELDPHANLGSNLDKLFKDYKKLDKARRLGLEREKQNREELQQLEEDIQLLSQQELSLDDLVFYYRRYRLPIPQSQSSARPKQHAYQEGSKPFKSYQSSTGHLILVGKGPQENDELTKAAKSNDYWIHAAGVAGSHVIVPAEKDIRDKLPEALLKEAAILALHFSKFKGSLAGECYVARKGDIKKRKGMPAGLWNVERCKTLFFRYDQEELEEILNRLQAT